MVKTNWKEEIASECNLAEFRKVDCTSVGERREETNENESNKLIK